MSQSLIEHLRTRATALDAEAQIVLRWAGENAARGPHQAAEAIRDTIDSWLNGELDLRQAIAETGLTDRWLRERFPSTGSGTGRRWKRRDLAAARVAGRTGEDSAPGEATLPPRIDEADATAVSDGVAEGLRMIA